MLGQRLRELREEKGLTQKALGELLGVTDAAIGQWENNRREPSGETLVKLARIFSVPTDYLLGLEVQESADLGEFLRRHQQITYDGWEMGPEEKEDIKQFFRIAKLNRTFAQKRSPRRKPGAVQWARLLVGSYQPRPLFKY